MQHLEHGALTMFAGVLEGLQHILLGKIMLSHFQAFEVESAATPTALPEAARASWYHF